MDSGKRRLLAFVVQDIEGRGPDQEWKTSKRVFRNQRRCGRIQPIPGRAHRTAGHLSSLRNRRSDAFVSVFQTLLLN